MTTGRETGGIELARWVSSFYEIHHKRKKKKGRWEERMLSTLQTSFDIFMLLPHSASLT